MLTEAETRKFIKEDYLSRTTGGSGKMAIAHSLLHMSHSMFSGNCKRHISIQWGCG